MNFSQNSILHHSLMSFNHSLHALILLVSHSIIRNITCFTSLLSFILQMCPKTFTTVASFQLSVAPCSSCTLLRTSSFVIFCSHMILNILLQHFILNASNLSLSCFFNVHVSLAYLPRRSRTPIHVIHLI